LPENISNLFHEAFETTSRPLPAQWIVATNQLLQQMSTCSKTKLHVYPNTLANCPWCHFKEKRNILYFIDDIYSTENNFPSDFEQFIQGFRIDPVHIPEPNLTIPNQPFNPPDHSGRLRKYERDQKIIAALLGVIAIIMFMGSVIGGFIILGLIVFVYLGLPWKWKLRAELKDHKEKYQRLSERLTQIVHDYQSRQDIEQYQHHGKRVAQLISQYTEVPNNIQLKKRLEEERFYNQQLHSFLQQFRIQDHAIPSFGASRKQALYNAGIISASDISKLGNIKVQGIGPKYEQLLFSWQRQMASGFVYHPDNHQLNKAFLKIIDDAANAKKQLEQEIRSQYNGLHQLRQHIIMKRKHLQTQITDVNQQVAQAQAELRSFKQLIRVV
ncbi:MAG: hypothetical protein J7578_10280, partial [Chitinophagaceae bacterium]|nr:hypothetical protein [Chitinophagaceae bacterium]